MACLPVAVLSSFCITEDLNGVRTTNECKDRSERTSDRANNYFLIKLKIMEVKDEGVHSFIYKRWG